MTGPAAGRGLAAGRQVLRQSEHLNFFTESGIQEILHRAGRIPLAIEKCSIVGPDGAQVICIRALAESAPC